MTDVSATELIASIDTTRTFINGAWFRQAASDTIPVTSPHDGTTIATVPRHGEAVVAAAVRAAARAQDGWAATSVGDRATALRTLADLVDRDLTRIAAVVAADVGTPIRISEAVQVGLPARVLRGFADDLETYTFEQRIGNSIVTEVPIGVVAAITPWNYPIHQSVAKIGAALAAGCTIVHKPSEVAPLGAILLAELLAELGLPAGVFNQVSGYGNEAGEALIGHPLVEAISFTGSTAVGRHIAKVAAANFTRVSLELGGKSPSIILPGADLAAAVRGSLNNAFLNSGQTCTAWTRLLVPAANYDEVAELLATRAAEMESRLGPLVSETQWERVQGFIRDAIDDGATLIAGGLGRPLQHESGYHARATVVGGVRPDARIAQEEVFGPVLTVLAYDTIDEAIAIANGTRYGLAAGVWGPDETAATEIARRIRAGQVDVNGAPFNERAPFGGVKSSGIGREFGHHGITEFLEPQSIQLPAPRER